MKSVIIDKTNYHQKIDEIKKKHIKVNLVMPEPLDGCGETRPYGTEINLFLKPRCKPIDRFLLHEIVHNIGFSFEFVPCACEKAVYGSNSEGCIFHCGYRGIDPNECSLLYRNNEQYFYGG